MTSTSAALRASISAALSEAFRTEGRVDARAVVLRLDVVLASRLFEVVVVAVVDVPRHRRRPGRGFRAEGGRLVGEKSETRENLNRRAMTGVDGCNSGARLRHGHLSHTLVSSLLRLAATITPRLHRHVGVGVGLRLLLDPGRVRLRLWLGHWPRLLVLLGAARDACGLGRVALVLCLLQHLDGVDGVQHPLELTIGRFGVHGDTLVPSLVRRRCRRRRFGGVERPNFGMIPGFRGGQRRGHENGQLALHLFELVRRVCLVQYPRHLEIRRRFGIYIGVLVPGVVRCRLRRRLGRWLGRRLRQELGRWLGRRPARRPGRRPGRRLGQELGLEVGNCRGHD